MSAPSRPRRAAPGTARRAAGPRRVHDAAATREALLNAATRVFAERGFAGARVDEIARRSGVNKAMISYHFAGKAGLYREILAAGFGDFRARLEPLRRSPGPAEERLRRFADALAAVATARPFFIAMVFRELASAGSAMDREIAHHVMSVVEVDRDIIAEGIAAGDFRRTNPLLAHLSFAGGLLFVLATIPFRQKALVRAQRNPRSRGVLRANDAPCLAPESAAALASFVEQHHDLFTRGLLARPRSTRRRKA